ncbi:uncharacterized protein [Typha angustifolia]|uniref:uncharacterized protein n=1 Tax=Typha angustifolia TaxID=59011 RepID=UPI003C2D479B
MSRCFPFPPPNFDEAGIESLKLQKEGEKAKKERRKEKRRAKKEKANQEHENLQHSTHGCKRRKYDDWNLQDQKDSKYTRTSNDSVEQLEKSSLTEDHELQFTNQNTYGSPASSQDSIKKRSTRSANNSHCKNGFILRIRLPSTKQRDLEPVSIMQPLKVQAPELPTISKLRHLEPSRVRRQSNRKSLDKVKKHSTCVAILGNQRNTEQQAYIFKLGDGEREPSAAKQEQPEDSLVNEEPCCSGRDMEVACQSEAMETTHNHSSTKKSDRSVIKMERRFKELILNLNPLLLQSEQTDVSDQEWLFGSTSKQHPDPSLNRFIKGEGLPSHKVAVSLEQPRACYLPEFDSYQLPYVIPY